MYKLLILIIAVIALTFNPLHAQMTLDSNGDVEMSRLGVGISPDSQYGIRGLLSSSPQTTGYGVNGRTEGITVGYGIYGEAIDGWISYGVYGIADASTYARAGYFNGDVTVTGDISESSDERLKRNIRSVDGSDMLGRIGRLQPRRYENMPPEALERKQNLPNLNTGGEGEQLGLVAQELEEVFPELVDEVPHVLNEGGLSEGMEPEITTTKAVKYRGLIIALIAAVQEQQAQIEELQQQVD